MSHWGQEERDIRIHSDSLRYFNVWDVERPIERSPLPSKTYLCTHACAHTRTHTQTECWLQVWHPYSMIFSFLGLLYTYLCPRKLGPLADTSQLSMLFLHTSYSVLGKDSLHISLHSASASDEPEHHQNICPTSISVLQLLAASILYFFWAENLHLVGESP